MWNLQSFLTIISVTMVMASRHCLTGRRYLRGLDPDAFPTAHQFEGVYLRLETEINGHPLYSHETRQIIAMKQGDYLHIKARNSMENVHLRTRLGTRIWEYYDEFDKAFKYAGELHFACAFDATHQCSVESFRFESTQPFVPPELENRDFKLIPGMKNGRPKFKTDSEMYLFHNGEDTWQVADGLDSDPSVLVQSSSLNPAYISAEWEMLNFTKDVSWVKVRGLHLSCQSELDIGDKTCQAHDPCLNDATCHKDRKEKFCLCAHGYTNANCSQRIPSCPAPELVPGAEAVYSRSELEAYFVGDSVVMRCNKTVSPKPYVRITCQQDASGVVTWSDDVTCLRSPPIPRQNVPLPQQAQVEPKPGYSRFEAIMFVCVGLLLVIIVVLVWVVVKMHRRNGTSRQDVGTPVGSTALLSRQESEHDESNV